MARDERVFTMIIEHELMHQETLLYMMQQLPYDQKARPSWLPAPRSGGDGRPHRAGARGNGHARMRAHRPRFRLDNEFPSVQVFVPAFTVDETPVRTCNSSPS